MTCEYRCSTIIEIEHGQTTTGTNYRTNFFQNYIEQNPKTVGPGPGISALDQTPKLLDQTPKLLDQNPKTSRPNPKTSRPEPQNCWSRHFSTPNYLYICPTYFQCGTIWANKSLSTLHKPLFVSD